MMKLVVASCATHEIDVFLFGKESLASFIFNNKSIITIRTIVC
ncbi:MAG: hypothetical protein ABSF81_04165 [Bacteroidales bacterium]